MRKAIFGLILAGTLVWGSSIPGFAAINVVRGDEISTKIGDPPNGAISVTEPGVEIVFRERDPVSGIIPVYRDAMVAHFSDDSDEHKKLLFINLAGEIVIPPNENWRLVSGFFNGYALVQEKITQDLILINESGGEVCRFPVGEAAWNVARLSSGAKYQYMYVQGRNGGKINSPTSDLCAVFLSNNGEWETVALGDKYWMVGEYQDMGYAPLYKMTKESTARVSVINQDIPYYFLEQSDYLDENGQIHTGPMPGYQEEEKKPLSNNQTGLPYDEEKKAYIGSCYEVRENTNRGWMDHYYEVYDKEGNPTGHKLYTFLGGGDNYIIARAYDENLAQNYIFPYHIYYINEE